MVEVESFKKKHGEEWDQGILYYSPEKKEGESFHGWRARIFMEGGIPRSLNLSGKYGEKFHLSQMHDPVQKYIQKISFITETPLFFVEQYEQVQGIPTEVDANDKNAPTLIASNVAVVVFDLTMKLRPQLNLANILATEKVKKFEIKQKNAIKQKQAQWKQHIMVLDAMESDVHFSGEELVHFFGTHNHYDNFSKSGGDFKREAKKFPAKYKEILKGYYSE